MQQHASNNGPHQPSSSRRTALELVTALTEQQHQSLRDFADKRLRRVLKTPGAQRCLAGRTPADLVHSALEKLLLGDAQPRKGRKLSARNRASTAAFVECVQGIINSELSNAVRAAELSFLHVPIGDQETEPGTVEVPEPIDLSDLVERRDVQRELFARLEALLPHEPALEPVVRHWAEHFEIADRIGGPQFDSNLVYRVRQHARRILRELARETEISEVTGMEMLM